MFTYLNNNNSSPATYNVSAVEISCALHVWKSIFNFGRELKEVGDCHNLKSELREMLDACSSSPNSTNLNKES
jgi:hypothetical protein